MQLTITYICASLGEMVAYYMALFSKKPLQKNKGRQMEYEKSKWKNRGTLSEVPRLILVT
ncbi:MAG: hypothetical protein IPN76_32680 [Saprospiraceae bacterium]|nr:hypothetical protein [Saprospiraceae bacterium]